MPSHAFRHIVFDWNSTLLDDIGALVDCLNIILEQHGRPIVDLDTYQRHYEVPFEKLYRNHGFSDADIAGALSAAQNVFHDHYEPRAAIAGLRGGASDILNYAKAHGIACYILSNHLVEPIKGQLRRLEIDTLFTEVLAYADRTTQFRDMTKGERLRRYMVANKINPRETIIVGDSVEEIEIGHEQNIISVAITGGCVSETRLRAANPDYMIHQLSELKNILQTHKVAA